MLGLKQKLASPVFRYLLVGTICTIVGMGLMFLLFNLFHVDYWLSSALNYGIGGVLGYYLNCRYTFAGSKPSVFQAVRYGLVLITCYASSFGLAIYLAPKVLVGYNLKLIENVALLIGTLIYSVLFYYGMKIVVFCYKDTRSEEKSCH